jgi:cytochrome c oxidase subunit 2
VKRTPHYALATIALMAAASGRLSAAERTLESVVTDYSYCTVCHGTNGHGNIAIGAPALAGIEPWYLAAQLKSYRAQQRGQDFSADPSGAEMRTVAREITDDQMAEVVSYIGRLTVETKTPSVQGDPAKGKRLYAAHCAACHGAHADGDASLHAPSLSRLNDWYIVASYRKYRSGIRGASADNPWGNQMHLIAKALPDDFSIDDVSAYLTTIHIGKRK